MLDQKSLPLCHDHHPVQWVFLGYPGVGKGTYASRLSNLLDVPHISTGDLVREELSSFRSPLFLGPLGSEKKINDLYEKIKEKIKDLRDCFEMEVTVDYDDEELAWLFVAFGQQDLFLLENQLPYRLLKWLMSWSENEDELKNSIERYIQGQLIIPEDQHSMFLKSNKANKQSNIDNPIASRLLGYLFLPPMIVDDSTRPKFLNLIAYEICLDFENDFGVTSYISFLDSLIDEANDVKMLRKVGVLYNCLGSDEEVAKLFNKIGTDLVPNTQIYSYVRLQIQKHYKNKWMTWMAQFFHNHFSSPWMIFAFYGVLVGLELTGIQTWLVIHPAK
uniref:adenylate kinase n=1 Tax=Fagus sylvatica TaxID=28930 RepID=A0A2N9FZI6_FAGSY